MCDTNDKINKLMNDRQITCNLISYGDIFLVNLDNGNKNTSIQKGTMRPCIIISNDKANMHSPVLTIIPLTSKLSKNNLSTHVSIDTKSGLRQTSIALTEQIMSIDKSKLICKVGKCSSDVLEKITTALKIQSGIMDIDYIFQIVDSINEIEEYAMKYGFDPDDMKAHIMHIKDLKAYCNQYNYDYITLLREKKFVKTNEEYNYRNVI